jgi:3-phenylpropionate/trans-cinnamate dioxygenase ferredoxin reductase subunit
MAPDAVIVGNGVAGLACARKLARHGLAPLLVGPGLPHDRPPLSKTWLAAGVARPAGDAETLSGRGIELLDGSAESVDVEARRVSVRSGGELVELEAPAIVLALGLRYLPPPVPGLEGAFVNASPQGLAELATHLAGGPKRVLIVGAGLIGTESAATLAVAGHTVTMLDIEPRPLNRLHDPIPAIAADVLAGLGVRFVGGVGITGAALGSPSVVSTPDEEFEADVVIAATGGRLPELPGMPGPLPLEVDDAMRVPGLEGIYAIGDCASPVLGSYGRVRFPHWDAAMGMGDRAADAIAGAEGFEGAFDRMPYWWSDIGPRTIAEVGVAAKVAAWQIEDGLHVGRDETGAIVCVFVADDPKRLRDARQLLQEALSNSM